MNKEMIKPNEINPLQLLHTAIEKGIDPSTLGKLYDLQERFEINQAKKAFNSAMSEFSQNSPKLVKDKNVAFKSTKYKYVTLASIVAEVQKITGNLGLSHRWETSQNDNYITVKCVLTHQDGHSVSSSFSAPADTSGAKNSIQAIGSTITYGQRYTLLSILGLSAFEDDDAKNVSCIEFLSQGQTNKINSLIDDIENRKIKFLKNGFLKYFAAQSIENIRADDFDRAIEILNKKLEVQNAE